MSKQKWVTAFPNGAERTAACNKCLKKLDAMTPGSLTLADLNRITTALKLRADSEFDNGESHRARITMGTMFRVMTLIDSMKTGGSE